MQADGRGWLYAPAGLADGPLPTHYEPQESPVRQPAVRPAAQPGPARSSRPQGQPLPARPAASPAREVFPYVVTTYRLTEHHTAGGMIAVAALPVRAAAGVLLRGLARSWPPSAGLEHGGWATIVTARTAIEARVLVTDRMPPLTVAGPARCTRSACPTTGGRTALTTGDAANELLPIALDPNVHIQEVKALPCDIRPGRRPRGPALLRLRRRATARRAGITEQTGTERATMSATDRCRTAATRPPTPATRPAAAHGLLHRHQRSASAARPARWRARSGTRVPEDGTEPARHVLRQHRRARRRHLAARGVHRAAQPVGQAASPELAARRRDAATGCRTPPTARPDFRWLMASRRVQALHPRRLPGRVPDRRAVPHRVRHRRRAGGRLQRLRLLRAGLPVRRHRPAPRTTAGCWKCTLCYDRLGDGHGAGLREGVPDRVDPVRRRWTSCASGPSGRVEELRRGRRHRRRGCTATTPTTASAAPARSSCCSTSPRSTACRRTRW